MFRTIVLAILFVCYWLPLLLGLIVWIFDTLFWDGEWWIWCIVFIAILVLIAILL